MDIIGYDFGLLLRELRERANLTQKQLGNKVGVSEGMISRYENNMSEPPFETMRSFAAIFNVSMDYLAGMEKQKTLSMQGITEEQMEILSQLAEMFTLKNLRKKSAITLEQYELVKRILDNLASTST